MSLYVNGKPPLDSNLKVTLNQWQHVAVSYNDRFARFYVNGQADIPLPYARGLVHPNRGQPLGIGADPGLLGHDKSLYGFEGRIGIAGIWPRVLTDDEVQKRCEGTMSSTIQKKRHSLLSHALFGLLLLWLIVGILLYIQNHMNMADWHNWFLLRDNILMSTILFVLAGISYWALIYRRWIASIDWGRYIGSLSRTIKITIIICIIFYTSLVVMTLFAANMPLKSEWAILLVVAIPLLAPVFLTLIETSTSVKAKFPGVEVELQRAMMTQQDNQTLVLDERIVIKGTAEELHQIANQAQKDQLHILGVRIGGKMRVTASMLKQYVYELSKVSPIRYIIFVDNEDRYIGFRAYPETWIEIWYSFLFMCNKDTHETRRHIYHGISNRCNRPRVGNRRSTPDPKSTHGSSSHRRCTKRVQCHTLQEPNRLPVGHAARRISA